MIEIKAQVRKVKLLYLDILFSQRVQDMYLFNDSTHITFRPLREDDEITLMGWKYSPIKVLRINHLKVNKVKILV